MTTPTTIDELNDKTAGRLARETELKRLAAAGNPRAREVLGLGPLPTTERPPRRSGGGAKVGRYTPHGAQKATTRLAGR